MDQLQDYLLEEAVIVIPVLLIIGKIIKQTPWIKDWFIPYILLIFGVTSAIYLLGTTVDAVLQGILLTGAAVYSNQLFKQTKERDCK